MHSNQLSRLFRGRITTALTITALILTALILSVRTLPADDTIDIGSQRQLFVDRALIDKIHKSRLVLHHPVKREIAIKPEHPWETNGVSYMVTFKDGDRFRAWYRVDAAGLSADRHSMTAYAESDNGIHWHKPKLGLIEFDGSKENNLVWNGDIFNLAVFRDDNPRAKPDERYKAIGRKGDLLALLSPDGLRWKPAGDKPIHTDRPFDSHNIAFWDPVAEQYVAYTRGVRQDGSLGEGMTGSFFKGGVRWVRRSTSKDFRTWSKLEPIQTGKHPREEFYTNSTIRYERAPDYLLMFPSRFASTREPQPGWKHGKGVNDIALLTSRDGLHFERTFMEAFIRPGLDQGNWHERSLYMERGILQTSPTELSLYCMQNWRLPTVHIRRYTLRPDGFVSVQAAYDGGELITKPITFSGKRLFLNYSTSAVGSLKVELQDAAGKPLNGFAIDDCPEVYGDRVDAPIRWKSTGDVSSLAGKAIRIRFVLRDADLYALRFGEE
ncbi:MAG: hypothetical protein CMJ64_24220 [Planctomycetaceae bacterium]|nr:hypothetical protein [Planctomycetaceae bacterium]